jgi:hypothetical protein
MYLGICLNAIGICLNAINETTDIIGRYVANFVIGILNETGSCIIFLLHSEQLEKCNHSTIY